MTYKDEASYNSTPPCIHGICVCLYIHIFDTHTPPQQFASALQRSLISLALWARCSSRAASPNTYIQVYTYTLRVKYMSIHTYVHSTNTHTCLNSSPVRKGSISISLQLWACCSSRATSPNTYIYTYTHTVYVIYICIYTCIHSAHTPVATARQRGTHLSLLPPRAQHSWRAMSPNT